MTEEILKRLDALAVKLGVTGTHLWGVLVQQARIEAFECIGWALVWIGIGIFCVRKARKSLKFEDPDKYFEIRLGLYAAFAVSIFICFMLLAGVPSQIINPEYWALKEVIKAVGK
jgi:hypothetical protein